jgi:Fe-S-cluster containining protein
VDSATLTRKEATWLACQKKTCCYTSLVVPSGRDIWRIARALQAPPWTFVLYFATAAPRPDAFILDRSGQSFRLALAKQPSGRKKSLPPCIFLMRTRTGYHRCGLGALRPQVCRTFPAEVVAGVLYLRDDMGCTCRDWSLADADIADEQALMAVRQSDYQEYCTVVARWNAQVAAGTDAPLPTFFDFCDFLLAAYDEIAGQATGDAAS